MKNYQIEDLKNYKIMVLGVPGSGKTLFLASMYEKLSVQSTDMGFFLKADDLEQGKQLVRIYTTVADPKQEWPTGTLPGDRADWHFTCCVDGPNPAIIFESFHFTYFDYAGQFITEQQEPIFVELFNNMLQEADVYLAILDGQKILEFMGNQPDRLLSDLRFILPILQTHKKPIHFIITKWDLLEEGNYSFEDILGKLEHIESFKNLTQKRVQEHKRVRVIPVSSLGRGFAELRDGSMQKKEGATPHPLRVEIPLVCLLIDKLEDRLGALQREESEVHAIRPPSTATARMYQFLRGGLTFAQWAVSVLSFLALSQEMREKTQSDRAFLKSLKDYLKNMLESQRKQAQEKQRLLDSIVNEQDALNYTIGRFLNLIETIEREFPKSLLE